MSETGAGMRRSGGRGRMRAAASLPHIARARGEEGGGAGRRSPCLLVALRPRNVETERERFFRERFAYDPQFEYAEPVPEAVLEKYRDASDRFVAQVRVAAGGRQDAPGAERLRCAVSAAGWARRNPDLCQQRCSLRERRGSALCTALTGPHLSEGQTRNGTNSGACPE